MNLNNYPSLDSCKALYDKGAWQKTKRYETDCVIYDNGIITTTRKTFLQNGILQNYYPCPSIAEMLAIIPDTQETLSDTDWVYSYRITKREKQYELFLLARIDGHFPHSMEVIGDENESLANVLVEFLLRGSAHGYWRLNHINTI